VNVRVRYALLQLPGWILAGVILYALHRWLGLPLWVAAILMAADLVKDIALYPYLRRAYETGGARATDRLVGETAEVAQTLSPNGYVRLRGELWRARLVGGASEAQAGDKVVVEGAEGLVLQVAGLGRDVDRVAKPS
jgi:membrane protein implicated in regulation of membrane protease activity